jgi:hypothetical protein
MRSGHLPSGSSKVPNLGQTLAHHVEPRGVKAALGKSACATGRTHTPAPGPERKPGPDWHANPTYRGRSATDRLRCPPKGLRAPRRAVRNSLEPDPPATRSRSLRGTLEHTQHQGGIALTRR